MPLDPAGKRVTVMGLGRFGGGAGVATWLADRGAQVTVTDLRTPETLQDACQSLSARVKVGTVKFVLGKHVEADFTESDLIIANPAVPQPWQNAYLMAARAAGVRITTEIRLAIEHLNRKRVIGVTGSAGKSTTCAMIHHALQALRLRSHLGGNIGGSLLNQLDEILPNDWVVLELSSFMLYWLGARDDTPGWSPGIALLTNIEPNHLDWHGTFEHYQKCKDQIFTSQENGDVALREHDALKVTPRLSVPGDHNLVNARLALAAVCAATGREPREVEHLLEGFGGLPHRLEFVCDVRGIRCYNDSKSTTPNATVLAVDSFEEASRVHLIVGGYDKGSDLTPIIQLVPRLGGIYTIGATGRSISETDFHETLHKAVDAAFRRMTCGDVLLLSPGCASWDQYPSFDIRGEEFKALVSSRCHA